MVRISCGSKPSGVLLRSPKTLQSQSRAGEKDEASATCVMTSAHARVGGGAVAAAARAGFVQDAAERSEPRDAPGRPDANERFRKGAQSSVQEQRYEIDPRFLKAERLRRTEREDDVETPNREEQTERRRRRGASTALS